MGKLFKSPFGIKRARLFYTNRHGVSYIKFIRSFPNNPKELPQTIFAIREQRPHGAATGTRGQWGHPLFSSHTHACTYREPGQFL